MKAYQERGEAGLRDKVRSSGNRRKLPGPVRKKILEIKKREPFFGVQRISHLLKRVFFLSASPETVRRTLQEESLIVPSRKKRSSNITRPRFLERSTPDQLWQGDIFTFRLGAHFSLLGRYRERKSQDSGIRVSKFQASCSPYFFIHFFYDLPM